MALQCPPTRSLLSQVSADLERKRMKEEGVVPGIREKSRFPLASRQPDPPARRPARVTGSGGPGLLVDRCGSGSKRRMATTG
uniref:Uncharacterized protein n=1 Tax=Oryza meridionalis TaxID=40149 RepID=A0A0E0CEJ1_9ORYZ